MEIKTEGHLPEDPKILIPSQKKKVSGVLYRRRQIYYNSQT